MADTTLGYLLIGLAILFVLAVVFTVSARTGPRGREPAPPRGVHLASPSWLPVLFALAGGLIAAGLAFRPDAAEGSGSIAQLWLLVPGLAIFILAALGWVRAAGREWHQAERGGHEAHGEQHGQRGGGDH